MNRIYPRLQHTLIAVSCLGRNFCMTYTMMNDSVSVRVYIHLTWQVRTYLAFTAEQPKTYRLTEWNRLPLEWIVTYTLLPTSSLSFWQSVSRPRFPWLENNLSRELSTAAGRCLHSDYSKSLLQSLYTVVSKFVGFNNRSWCTSQYDCF